MLGGFGTKIEEKEFLAARHILAGFVFLGGLSSTTHGAGLRRVNANPELICLIRRES